MYIEDMSILSLSAHYLWDHLDRLYVETDTPDQFDHIDVPGAAVTIVNKAPGIMTIELTAPAATELLADARYQDEFADIKARRAQARRVIAHVERCLDR